MMSPLLRTLSLCLIAGLSLLLSACAHQPVRSVYTNSSLPEYWEAEGKAAIRSEEHGGNIYFTWTQQGPDYHIIVRGPLGLGRAELNGTPGQVTLVADNIPEVSAGSLEELLEATTHHHAPISHALHWLKAEPGGSAAEVTRGPDGKLTQIKEDGWTINYLEWSEEAPMLPRKLTLAGPEGQATVVIGLWRLHLSAENP
ncbi:MAG: lipoprotein insertase outer membrane protein LolB [bacterium]|nr:lipoprotein insertase outer membrane protein LolB [bacterium]